MRVLIISPTQSGIGGIAQHVKGLSNFLKKNGNEVEIISSENTFTIPIRKLKNPSFILSAFFKTKFKKNYDIVHAQNPLAALAMKNVSGKKILSIWGIYSKQVELLHGKTTGKLSDKFEKKALEWADAITVASKEIQEHYSKFGHKIDYIPNAIDLESLPREENRKYKKQLIFAGRLSKEKGIFDLIELSKQLPDDIHLLILGDGPEKEKILETSEKKSNFHYLGLQPKEKTISLIRGSDILIQPSLMEGGINTTLLEAMACKTPIITTFLKVYEDEIIHLENAYCVMPNSPKEILKGVLELLSDIQKRVNLADTAYRIAQNHSWEKVGPMYLEIYKKSS